VDQNHKSVASDPNHKTLKSIICSTALTICNAMTNVKLIATSAYFPNKTRNKKKRKYFTIFHTHDLFILGAGNKP
jgi:hypothetical protein